MRGRAVTSAHVPAGGPAICASVRIGTSMQSAAPIASPSAPGADRVEQAGDRVEAPLHLAPRRRDDIGRITDAEYQMEHDRPQAARDLQRRQCHDLAGPRALQGRAGEQRRAGQGLIEIGGDRVRFAQRLAVIQLQQRDAAHRADRTECRRPQPALARRQPQLDLVTLGAHGHQHALDEGRGGRTVQMHQAVPSCRPASASSLASSAASRSMTWRSSFSWSRRMSSSARRLVS